MATHAGICRSLRQRNAAHYGNEMNMGRVCCRGSCCPIIVIMSVAPATRRIAAITGVRMLSFIAMNYCLWTRGSCNIQRRAGDSQSIRNVDFWNKFLFRFRVPQYLHICRNFCIVTHGVGACTHRIKLGGGGKEWQMPPQYSFYLRNTFWLLSWRVANKEIWVRLGERGTSILRDGYKQTSLYF